MSSEMETLKEIQNEFLKCPICLQKYSNPKLLPCLHTFCRQCLAEYLNKYCENQNGETSDETDNNAQKHDSNAKHVCCPVCRSDVQLSVPHGNKNTIQWTELLPDNHFVSSLVEKIDMHTSEQNCESCSRDLKSGGAKADNWCHTCKILFCESCIKAHNVIKACREHKITSLKDMRNAPLQSIRENRREIPCFHHKDKFIEYYCVDCHVAICSSCVAVQHRRCEMVETINDAVQKLKPEAEYVTKSLQQQIETLLQWEKDHAKEIAMLSTNKEEMIRDMKLIRVKVNEVLMNLENKLIEDLDDKFKNTAEEVRNKVKDIDEMKKNVQNTSTFFRNLSQFGSDSELLAVFDAIKIQVDDMRATIQKARLSQLSKSLRFAPDPCIERLLHLTSYGKIVDIIDLNKESFLSFNGLSEREPNTPHRRSSIKRTGTFRVTDKQDSDQQSPMQTGSSTSSMSSTSTDSVSSQELIPQVTSRRVPPKPSPRSHSAKTGMQRNTPVRAGTLPRNLKIRERPSLGSVTRVNSVGSPNGILSPGTSRKADRNANTKADAPEPPARKPAVPKQAAPAPPKKTSSVPLLFAFNGKTDGDAKKCWPLDVAVLEDGTPVITDFHNKKVKAFDASGTVMGEVAVPSWPHGIVDTGSKEVAVTLPELATIVFVSVQEKNMRIRKRLRTQKQYRGISCDGFTSTSNPVLVVSCCASGSQCVDILTFDGVVMQTYREDKSNPDKLLFTWPYYVATNAKGEIIVSDCQSRNAIMCVCRDGIVRYEEVLQDSLVSDPRGICADRQGNLFLADKTGNSVHCLDGDGKYKAKVLAPSDGLLHPIAVCLSPFGHLIVTQENGEVKVFKYS